MRRRRRGTLVIFFHFRKLRFCKGDILNATCTCCSGASRWRYSIRSVMQHGFSPNFPKNCTISSKGSPVRNTKRRGNFKPRRDSCFFVFLIIPSLPSRLSSGQPRSRSLCNSSSRAKYGPLSAWDSLPSSSLILSSTNLTTSATV